MSRRVRSPLVSVVLPVYNGERYLRRALDGLWAQTYGNFEVIAVDDGSTDATPEILGEESAGEPRLRVVRLPENRGIVDALNRGIRESRGELIARQDVDDLSAPERFELQVDRFCGDESLGVLGTGYVRVRGAGRTLRQPPVKHEAIRWSLAFGNTWCHSSVMMRREVFTGLRGPYRHVRHAEDYDLWLRLAATTRLATVDRALVDYEERGDSILGQEGHIASESARAGSHAEIERLCGRRIAADEHSRLLRLRSRRLAEPSDFAPSLEVLVEVTRGLAREPGMDRSVVGAVFRGWCATMPKPILRAPWSASARLRALLALRRAHASGWKPDPK